MAKPFEPFVIAESVRARIRADGGPLMAVRATRVRTGERVELEHLCPQDARQQLREIEINGPKRSGLADPELVKIR